MLSALIKDVIMSLEGWRLRLELGEVEFEGKVKEIKKITSTFRKGI